MMADPTLRIAKQRSRRYTKHKVNKCILLGFVYKAQEFIVSSIYSEIYTVRAV